MNPDLEKAIKILNEENVSLAAVRGEEIFTDVGIGVKPIVAQIRETMDFFRGYSVADKVIGRAAALLFVLSGAKCVYGKIMSEHAIGILEEYNVQYSFKELVPFIENREKNGMCPLEESVINTDNPLIAYENIMFTISKLMKNK